MHNNIITVVGITILFLGTCITPTVAVDNVNKISLPTSSGNTLYVGGTGEGNYTKIQDAIDDASDGDTVFVYAYSSPYYEHVKINKTINLIGEDRNTTIIDSDFCCTGIKVSADWVNISGFTIRNGASGIVIGSPGYNYNIIKDNIISNNDNGIYIGDSSSNNIIDNKIFSNNHDGIYLGYSNSNSITANNISNNNDFGIFLYKSKSNSITANNISFNGESIKLYFSDNNNITFNNILNNGKGINLSYSHDNFITSNNINLNNVEGMNICYSSYNTITGNNISNNMEGIKFKHFSNNNFNQHNNFINNDENAYDEYDNIWDNGKTGNYWDDYTGEDNDGDGIGDTPYPIPGGNEDKYPLMEPWGENQPPSVPNITGPTHGKPGQELVFIFNAVDPDGNDVRFHIYWGGGSTNTTDFVPSGTDKTATHMWDYWDTYLIKVYAEDEFGNIGPLTTFAVTIPRDKATNNMLLLRLLERFPMLERLLNLFI